MIDNKETRDKVLIYVMYLRKEFGRFSLNYHDLITICESMFKDAVVSSIPSEDRPLEIKIDSLGHKEDLWCPANNDMYYLLNTRCRIENERYSELMFKVNFEQVRINIVQMVKELSESVDFRYKTPRFYAHMPEPRLLEIIVDEDRHAIRSDDVRYKHDSAFV